MGEAYERMDNRNRCHSRSCGPVARGHTWGDYHHGDSCRDLVEVMTLKPKKRQRGRPFQKGCAPGPGRPPDTPLMKLTAPMVVSIAQDSLADGKLKQAFDAVVERTIKDGDPHPLMEVLNIACVGLRRGGNFFSVDIGMKSAPDISEMLNIATSTTWAELKRLEAKAAAEGLSEAEHRSLTMLAKTVMDVRETQIDISLKKRETFAKLPLDELVDQTKALVIEAEAKKKEIASD